MTLEEIRNLIAAMSSSDLTEMVCEKDGWTLRLSRGAAAPVAAAHPRAPAQESALRPRPAAAPAALESGVARAPLSGIVFLSASPGSAAFVAPGQRVKAGDILCTVEAMKMFNEVRAERDCVVEAVLVGAGDEVDAGQPLFRIG